MSLHRSVFVIVLLCCGAVGRVWATIFVGQVGKERRGPRMMGGINASDLLADLDPAGA